MNLVMSRLSRDNEIASPIARLLQVLGDRKPQPWGHRIGLKSATISSMTRNGHLPNAQLLERIQRAENLSLSWLLSGVGPPFLTMDGTTEAVMRAVRDTLADEAPPWSALLALTEGQAALVLYRRVALSEGLPEVVESRVFGGHDHYTAYVEALVSDYERLQQGWSRPQALRLPFREWLRLSGGWMGSYELWGDGEEPSPRVGTELRPLPMQGDVGQVMAEWFQVPHMVAEEGMDLLERDALEAFRALTIDDQAKAIRILRALRAPTK